MSDVDHERRAVELVMATRQYAETLAALVERTGRTEADLRDDSQTALTEMAAYVDESASRVWDRMVRWLTRSYEVDVDTSRLAELSELGRKHSLVFLPNHRSYLDPLVLRAATAGHGFPSNYTLGGINLAMWPLSELGKRSGLIFIRRSSREDPVYPAMLRLYLGFLLRQHANLEWYFEGGRTRTGKLRPPRMGVLRYLVDAFRANGDASDDAYLVPVSIVYDQQHEVSALSREESGGSKAPESLTWLYRFARAQGRRRHHQGPEASRLATRALGRPAPAAATPTASRGHRVAAVRAGHRGPDRQRPPGQQPGHGGTDHRAALRLQHPQRPAGVGRGPPDLSAQGADRPPRPDAHPAPAGRRGWLPAS